MSEVVQPFRYSLSDIITPLASIRSTDRLSYDSRHDTVFKKGPAQKYEPQLPEVIVTDLVNYSLGRLETKPIEDARSVEDQTIEYFLSRCGENSAIKVAASVLKHYDTIPSTYTLDGIQKAYKLPFSMGPDFQRKLFRSAVQFEHDYLQKELEKQLTANSAYDGVPNMKQNLILLESLIKKIDEREGGQQDHGFIT